MRKVLKINNETVRFLLLAVAAVISAIFPMHNMVGLSYTFNTLFFLLILYLYGRLEAYSMIILINLIIIFFFEGSVVGIIYILEILFIDVVKKKKNNLNLVGIDIIFWSIMSLILFGGILIFTNDSKNTINIYHIFNIVINGIINVLIVELILTYIPLKSLYSIKIEHRKHIKMNTLLFHISIVSILLTLVLNSTINSSYRVKNIEKNAEVGLMSARDRLINRLNTFTDDDIRKMKLLGTLQIEEIKNNIMDIHKLEGVEVTILNKNNKVIVSNKRNIVELESYNWKEGREIERINGVIWETIPEIRGNKNYASRWYNSSYVYDTVIENLDLIIVLEYPILNEIGTIIMDFNNQIRFMLIMGVSVAMLDLFINILILRTITRLAEITTDIPIKLNASDDIIWPKSRMTESKVLIDNFKVMTKKLNESHKSLENLAYYDLLTNLLNRTSFNKHLELAYKNIENEKLAVMFIDINGFKQINDTLGHNQGDNLLKLIADRLAKLQDESQSVFRLGGDEFVVVSVKDNINDIFITVNDILSKFEEGFILSGTEYKIGGSIGVSVYPDNTKDVESLTKNADIAMYKSKRSVGNKPCFYTEEIQEQFLEGIQEQFLEGIKTEK